MSIDTWYQLRLKSKRFDSKRGLTANWPDSKWGRGRPRASETDSKWINNKKLIASEADSKWGCFKWVDSNVVDLRYFKLWILLDQNQRFTQSSFRFVTKTQFLAKCLTYACLYNDRCPYLYYEDDFY